MDWFALQTGLLYLIAMLLEINPMSLTAAPPPDDRLHGLDALRGIALLLGVVLHTLMSFFPVQIWIVADSETSPIASVLFFAIHLFRMTTFVLLAGLFAHMMLARRGLWGFVKDRLIRIAGPLVGLWWLALGAIIAVLLWNVAIQNGGTLPTDGPPQPPMTAGNFPLTHLWFLWVLLIFYAAMLVLRAPFALLDRSGGWGRTVDRLTAALIGPWTPVVLAAPLALAFYRHPDWVAFFSIPTPDTGLMPNAVALTGFGTAFLFGFLLDRRRDLLERIRELWPVFTVVAVGTGAGAVMLAGGPVPDLAPVTDPSAKGALAAVMALAVFSGTMAAVSLSLQLFSRKSALRRYMADASYWIYIVHLPLVMVGQTLVLDMVGPWWLKASLVIAGTMGVSLITYELLVRHSFIGRWLNGRRIPWKRQAEPAAVPAE